MKNRTVQIMLVTILFCFPGILSAGEDVNLSLYKQVQHILDEYRGNTNDLKKANGIIQEIIKNNDQSKYALVAYGRLIYKSSHISRGNYNQEMLEQAKKLYDEAIKIDPNFYDTYYYGTYPYIFANDHENAKKMVTKAAEIKPESAKTYILLSEISEKEKNYNDIIKYAKLALSKNPDKKSIGDAYNFLANANCSKKNYNLSEEYHFKIINLEPNSAWARVNYSSFLASSKKNYDEAIRQGKKALEIMDFGMGHKVLGKAYRCKADHLHWNQNKNKESISYYLKSIQHDNTKSNIYYSLGIAHYKVGHDTKDNSHFIESKKYLQKALEINPKHIQAKKQLKNINRLLASLKMG